MSELWIRLAPILIVDVINPVLFAVMVYAAGTRRGVTNSSAILLGHTLAYFCAGVVIALGLEQISDRMTSPHTIDFVIGLVIGLLLLWAAWRSIANRQNPQDTTIPELAPLKAFGFGALVNFIGIPFALPYFAAVDQVLKADLSTMDALIALIAYNLVYALPFIIVPLFVAVSGKRSQVILQRINTILDRTSSFLMPVLLVLIGLALVVDAVRFLATGKALF